jgi:hypothetical protein
MPGCVHDVAHDADNTATTRTERQALVGGPDPDMGHGVSRKPRTITGAYTTTYRTDDGSSTTVAAPQPAGSSIAALVASPGSQAGPGYRVFPGTLLADGSFTIPNVPGGDYLLSVTGAAGTTLFEQSADMVGFSTVLSARPDLAYVSQTTAVTLNVTNLSPYRPGSSFWIYSSQANVTMRPFEWGGAKRPTVGSTSYAGTIDWNRGTMPGAGIQAGLPDAAKGDTLWVTHTDPVTVLTSGATTLAAKGVTRYAHLSDVTITDGAPGTMNVALLDAPQTGSLHADIRFTAFNALSPAMNAQAVSELFAVTVDAIPYSNSYPDTPYRQGGLPQLIVLFMNGSTAGFSDVDFGFLPYGQFLDARWMEQSGVIFYVNVPFTAPGATTSNEYVAGYFAKTSGGLVAPVTPTIGPPTSVLVNGASTLSSQAGVGFEPTVSWSSPTLGAATSYDLKIMRLDNVAGATGFTQVLEATVFSTAFKVPSGTLASGSTYFVDLTANDGAPWDVLDATHTTALPSPYAGCDVVTATFMP